MKPTNNGSVDSENLVETLARQLGQTAFDNAKDQAGEVITWEKLRREKSHQSAIASLKLRYHCLFSRRTECLEILRLAPSADPASLRRKRWYYQTFALTLILAGVFFAHLALAPFGLGREAWIVCLGIGSVGAFWTDRTLEKLNCETFLKYICVAALMTSLGGLLVMALIRGDILAFYLKTAASGAMPGELNDPGAAADFYSHAIWKLQLLMALLAVSMEMASGMAMFEAGKINLAAYQRAAHARKELDEAEAEMTAIVGHITHLENDPVVNEAEFWRNFYLGLLERIKRNGILHLVILGSLLWFGSASPATAQAFVNRRPATTPTMRVVIALDLTQSVAGKGYDGKTDYEKNVEAACHLITQLPPGTQFTVFAITDRSFSQPFVLLQRELPRDKGPLQFQDRIAIARAQDSSELRRLALFSPHAIPHTDIFGALILGSDILRQSPGRKVFVIFSDMRESTNELDFERAKTISLAQVFPSVEKRGLVAHLQGIEVYALGVDGTDKSVAYWNSLRDFWEAYFHKAGANLKSYSALRDTSFANEE